eukprot:m.12926 g.12926  ORF g.12926 m.12926 type:complete len:802 (+) comp10001_c0_seq2:461-2866(+)
MDRRNVLAHHFWREEKEFLGYAMASGATPVPVDPVSGKRQKGDYEFFYTGTPATKSFSSIRPEYSFGLDGLPIMPPNRKARLSRDKLIALGLNLVSRNDPVLYWQLLRPFGDPGKNGDLLPGVKDERIPYYTHVTKMTVAYCTQHEIGDAFPYGKCFSVPRHFEHARFDGVHIFDGAMGGSNGAIRERFRPSSVLFSKHISQSMKVDRYFQIRRTFKLCDNTAESCTPGTPAYDPAHKYTYVYECLTHNMNFITAAAAKDSTVDETTWGHGGYGEPASGIVSRLRNKKKCRGGQTVLLYDADRPFPRAFVHRHKLHPKKYKAQGPNELSMLLDKVDQDMAKHDGSVYTEKPHITCDNYFVNSAMLDEVAERNFGLLGTVARNRLPVVGKSVACWHKEKLPSIGAKCKSAKQARLATPIIGVRKAKKRASVDIVYTSFQSTGATNIVSVNSFPKMYTAKRFKKRGRGKNQRKWQIEWNTARALYLAHYNSIDVVDHLVQNCRLSLVSRKYWHAAKLHCDGLTIAAAFAIYNDVCDGNVGDEFVVPKARRFTFRAFREQLGRGLLQYHPANLKYLGDAALRTARQRGQRHIVRSASGGLAQDDTSVAQDLPSNIRDATCPSWQIFKEKHDAAEIFQFDPKMYGHFESIGRHSCDNLCVVCGERTKTFCSACNKPVHFFAKKNGHSLHRKLCFLQLHDVGYVGYKRCDQNPTKRASFKSPPRPLTAKLVKRRKCFRYLQQRAAEATPAEQADLPPTDPLSDDEVSTASTEGHLLQNDDGVNDSAPESETSESSGPGVADFLVEQ